MTREAYGETYFSVILNEVKDLNSLKMQDSSLYMRIHFGAFHVFLVSEVRGADVSIAIALYAWFSRNRQFVVHADVRSRSRRARRLQFEDDFQGLGMIGFQRHQVKAKHLGWFFEIGQPCRLIT
jgi:hypothetical protein